MAQGARKGSKGKKIPGIQLKQKLGSKQKSKAARKGGRKSTSATKIKKKLQLEISSRIEQELCAKATHDGSTFKVVSLKTQNKVKKNTSNKNITLGKKNGQKSVGNNKPANHPRNEVQVQQKEWTCTI